MDTELERLIAIGKRRGGLTVDDLQRHLPLEALSPAKLAEVLAVIEDAGVTVEIDPALTEGRPRKPAGRPTPPPASAEAASEGGRQRIAALESSIQSSKARAARAPHAFYQYRGGTAFLGAALVACIMLLIGLWLIDKGL